MTDSRPTGRWARALSLVVLVTAVAIGCRGASQRFHEARVAVWFSPDGGCTDAVVRELHAARREVLVQAYSFTSAPIAKALVDAHRRGVKVTAVLDDSNQTDRYSGATFLSNAGIPTRVDSAHAIAHNKVIVVDGETVITGSFNFTRAAEERNAENLVVIKGSRSLAQEYIRNFQAHLDHSQVYRRPRRGSSRRRLLRWGE